ncbi:MAG TPA: hypothetical protein VJA94_22460 [Candidatus Angelobacter sp.]
MFDVVSALLLSLSLFLQEPGATIPGLPNWSVALGLNPQGRVQSLLVYKGQQLAQTLDVCTEEPVARADPVGTMATADFNFDGFFDLALQVASEKSNQRFCVWLFDSQTRQFEASSQLSQLTNPVADPKTRTVVSTTFLRCTYCYERQEFRWSGKQLELIREQSLTMDPLSVGTGGCQFILTVKERKNGEMQETSRERANSFGTRCPY